MKTNGIEIKRIDEQVKYRGTGRDLKIKYTMTGRPYFMFRGRREYLENYIRCADGEMDAYKCTCNFGGIAIKIDDTGENVKAYWNY